MVRSQEEEEEEQKEEEEKEEDNDVTQGIGSNLVAQIVAILHRDRALLLGFNSLHSGSVVSSCRDVLLCWG